MKTTTKYVDKIYKLMRETAPLSLTLASRHTKRFPLLWFDEKKGINKALRYARNQNSPFQDEQDDNAIRAENTAKANLLCLIDVFIN